MSRVEPKQESLLSLHTINSPETLRALRVFSDLFTVCAGLGGKNHVVRNANGGHVTITSSCGRLLSAMSITRPELKLMTAAIEAHLQRFGDAGLFMAHVCSKLILLGCNLRLHHNTLNCLFDCFVNIVLDHLHEDACKVTICAGFDRLDILLAYVSSMLSSKCLLNLTCEDRDTLSRLIVHVFLDSVPREEDIICGWSSDRIHLITVENYQYSHSRSQLGVMLEWPERLPIRDSQEMNLKLHTLNEAVTVKLGLTTGSKYIKIALFTCSMSGDLEEMVQAHFEVTKTTEQEVEASVVGRMLKLCEALETLGVGVVLCQKVIHPKVKAALRSKEICFIDRIGSQTIPYLQDLTGAKPLSTVVDWSNVDQCLGWVTSVRHVVEYDKSYLLLSREDSPVVTLVLCAPWEEKLAELKACVRATLKGLSTLLKEKKLLMGGGCWQVYASQILKHKVMEQLQSIAKRLSCTETQVLKTLTVFRSSLQSWALALVDDSESLVVDKASLHVWRVPKGKEDVSSSNQVMACSCGLKVTNSHTLSEFQYLSVEELKTSSLRVEEEADVPEVVEDKDMHPGVVLDNFWTVTCALRQAVATANLVLSIGQFIVDKN